MEHIHAQHIHIVMMLIINVKQILALKKEYFIKINMIKVYTNVQKNVIHMYIIHIMYHLVQKL